MTRETQPHAFIMICGKPRTGGGNLDSVLAIPQVIEAHSVYGVYDAMVRVKAESMEEFKAINAKIRALPEIQSTITMFIM